MVEIVRRIERLEQQLEQSEEAARSPLIAIAERARIGAHARQRVRADFLMPRLLLDYLRLLKAVSRPRGA